jgi:hypothetical protein
MRTQQVLLGTTDSAAEQQCHQNTRSACSRARALLILQRKGYLEVQLASAQAQVPLRPASELLPTRHVSTAVPLQLPLGSVRLPGM